MLAQPALVTSLFIFKSIPKMHFPLRYLQDHNYQSASISTCGFLLYLTVCMCDAIVTDEHDYIIYFFYNTICNCWF